MPNWGPSGFDVYRRTYSRTKPDGTKEDWNETVSRVAIGNTSLVDFRHLQPGETEKLALLISQFEMIPAGRHLWASGVKNRQFLFNCWVSGWGESIADHFRFSFLRLMEGGGVGANYSSLNTEKYGPPWHAIDVHIVCADEHQDYAGLERAGVLSKIYSPDYVGAYMEVEDSREGWADALTDLLSAAWDPEAETVRVYDVSRVRASGSRLKLHGGYASGPVPLATMMHEVAAVVHELAPPDFEGQWPTDDGVPMDPLAAMEIDHAIATCVVSGGNRRSARMSILPWNDQWIHEFILAKQDTSKHWTTNISVGIDQDFFDSLQGPIKASKANAVLQAVAKGMLENGEPGFANLSEANEGEPNKVECSNPCNEIFLEDFEACNLGHLNLEAFVDHESGYGFFDLKRATRAARLMTRFLIRATFGDIRDPRSREVMDRNRRIGLGLMGVQAAFAKMGIRYSEIPDSDECWSILYDLHEAVREEARSYAFELRIPEPVKVTCIAPTGTISKMPGTTEGLHPLFSRYFIRRIRFSTIDPEQVAQLEQYESQGYNIEPCFYAANTAVVEIPTKERLLEEVEQFGYSPDVVESVDELDLRTLLRVQSMFQTVWADNAISFTANIPPGSMSVEELKELLLEYLPFLKGTTIMPDDTRLQAPYERITKEDYQKFADRTGLDNTADSVDEECVNGACPVR